MVQTPLSDNATNDVNPVSLPQADTQALSLNPFNQFDQADQRVIAAIDIGTNSIHMVIAQINPELPSFEIIDTEKSTVRLGERCPDTGNLTDVAIARAIAALRRCQEIAKARNVEKILTAATSAVREAPNGRDFIAQVSTELDLQIEMISGIEEARRIYLGVLSGMEFDNQSHIIVDIGGGSTELILGDSHKSHSLSSTKVGAVRLKELFIHHDPITKKEFDQMRFYVRGMMERPLDEMRSQLPPSHTMPLVGTSGTIESLVRISACEALGACPTSLHGYQLTRENLRDLIHRLSRLNYEERCKIPGITERRSEIILAGAVILLEVMESLQLPAITTCERSLREGMIVDWMLKGGLIEDRLRFQSSIRERKVLSLAKRYQVNLDSAKRIATFAIYLFDQTKDLLHFWGNPEREFLWCAAILHNSGHFVSHAAHHKHSYYLIRNAGLLGFTDSEIEMIANLARYHRKGPPKKKHDPYRNLSKRQRKIIDQLSAILKLAVALDRREIGAIAALQCYYHAAAKSVVIHLQPSISSDDCSLELWSLDYKKACFESEFGITLSAQLDL